VIQLILWIVDSGCSKHIIGNLQLLRNFIEKFIGTVRFGNDHFAAITGYGDYVQGNLMLCHNLEGDDLLTGSRASNLYTISISEMTASSPVIQLILWIVDSGCSKHIIGNPQLLRNFIEKFIGTVRFGNDHFAAITGYRDYVQGNLMICHVYYIEGRGHNLFLVE
nr:integrase, catalytic region, zinc finger, CCHC-type, peptidase aspartic, catalytic [Tanacetum cinerariifolium]